MYCHWATLAMDEPELIIVPFKMLPGESSHDWDSAEVKLERECIRQTFLGGKNEKSTDFSSELFKDLGGDLMINVLACNFRINGESNTDVVSMRGPDMALDANRRVE